MKNKIVEEQPNFEELNLKRHKFISSLNFYLRNSCRELSRRKLYYCLALFSVLIVVATTALSQTIIEYAPLILLKTAESNAAAKDIEILPVYLSFDENDGYNVQLTWEELLLNMTRIESLVDQEYPGLGTSRYEIYGSLIKATSSCNEINNPEYFGCKRFGVRNVFQNTERETKIGMGRDLGLPDEIPEGTVIISKKLAGALDVNIGDTVVAEIDITWLLKELVVPFNFQQQDSTTMIDDWYITNGTVYLPLKVHMIVESMLGKVPDGSTASTVLHEQKYFFKQFADRLPEYINAHSSSAAFIKHIKTLIPREFSNRIIYNLPDRMGTYVDSNFDNVQSVVVSFGSRISSLIGVFPFDMNLPIYEELRDTRFAGLFLGLILNIVIIVLFLLSVILIYNLLMVTIDTRSFEMGALRMLGLNKMGIIEMVFIQALTFVLPGIIFGMFLSLPLLGVISGFLDEKLHADIPNRPTGGAVAYAVSIGFLIPLISSYYPLKEALLKNLNIALDLVHSKTSSVHVSVELDMKKIPWTKITFGLLTVVFGICVYIFIPLSLLTFDIALLLSIFFGVLLGLLIGLVFLALNFQHLMERFVTKFFFFWTASTFRTVIVKNLVAHKLRNRKTSVMYALSLGFVIFLTVSLTMELKNLGYSVKQEEGALFVVEGTWSYLDKSIMENHIYSELQGVVESYTFITEELGNFLIGKGATDVEVSHRGRLYTHSARIVGIMPNFFKTTLQEFLIINDQDPDTGLDIAEQLYTARGSQSVILGTYYRDHLMLSRNPNDSLIIDIQHGINSRREEMRVSAVLDSAPDFRVSKIPSVTNQHIIVSLPTWARLAGSYIRRLNDVPIKKMLIKVYDDSDENLDIAYRSFTDLQTMLGYLDVWDFRDFEKSVTSNQEAISIIFISVEIVVFILCLFSLITSMSTNIMEQSKEVAVLRAIGVTKSMMMRIYIAEAFVLVFSSSLFGILIGVLVSWTMALQRILFTQIPITFSFPIAELIVVFFGAIASAVASTYVPAKRLVKNEIAQIIRIGG